MNKIALKLTMIDCLESVMKFGLYTLLFSVIAYLTYLSNGIFLLAIPLFCMGLALKDKYEDKLCHLNKEEK